MKPALNRIRMSMRPPRKSRRASGSPYAGSEKFTFDVFLSWTPHNLKARQVVYILQGSPRNPAWRFEMSGLVSQCADCMKNRIRLVLRGDFHKSGNVPIYPVIFAILLGFGVPVADADVLHPAEPPALGPSSGALAGVLEAGQESTDLELEPMAADDAEHKGLSEISGTPVIGNNPSASEFNARRTESSGAPMLLQRWIYPWP